MIPGLVDVGALRKVLPHGRYLATMEEVERIYAPSQDDNRSKIWSSFQDVNEIVRSVYGKLASVWIGGSFITSEEHPHDIDVVYLVGAKHYEEAVKAPRGQFVSQILMRRNPDIARLDNLVDAYLLPVPPTEVENIYNYSAARGYWDQFWSKARYADDTDGRWLYPAAGYLEVMVDGFND